MAHTMAHSDRKVDWLILEEEFWICLRLDYCYASNVILVMYMSAFEWTLTFLYGFKFILFL